ncbi:6-phosphogluconolactonase [Vallicoccus soli]|uniref:6-phosphogluconolactonase n=1 Tax=Vallicoccus soli TaxID=2339232 RepID=A0A3A3YSU0_9ACTN|nr:6-phosphogluconolactonase [Vallicoccus soli]RJK93760.1 6-phosphogluconolactonase [Vallicoccus soli]
MSTGAPVVVHRDAPLLARAVAARLVTRLVDAQASRGTAHVVLTGGGIGTRVLAELAASPARDAVDWARLHVWWGDERFVPADSQERNEVGARGALLDHVPLPPEHVHAVPAADGGARDVDEAAALYADELARHARSEDHAPVPQFDVLMLGVGPDAHVASLFPGQPALYEQERAVVGVRGAPKPPPLRVSLTLPAIRAAREVWLLAAGEEKAGAVGLALGGAGEVQVPAAGARGRRTLWLLDQAAAARLPRDLARPASP